MAPTGGDITVRARVRDGLRVSVSTDEPADIFAVRSDSAGCRGVLEAVWVIPVAIPISLVVESADESSDLRTGGPHRSRRRDVCDVARAGDLPDESSNLILTLRTRFGNIALCVCVRDRDLVVVGRLGLSD